MGLNKPVLTDKKQIEYFKSIVKGNTTKDIIDLFYKKYDRELSYNQVKSLERKYKLISGLNTKFTKGQKAHNWKPIGSEFTREDGYIAIKIAEPNKWQLKHHYIWEKANGKIPKGYSVIFLDQNRNNFDLDNLKLVKKEIKLQMCSDNLFFKNKQLTETGLLVAHLKREVKENVKFMEKVK